jgi:carbon-monoxide dehydrogenase medium subunit
MPYKEYRCPKSLEEALNTLHKFPKSEAIAGGTDLMIRLQAHNLQVHMLVDISRLPELKGIWQEGNQVFIGAATTYQEMIESQLLLQVAFPLVEASHKVGAAQIQHMGTIGGNIANASPAADLLPPLSILEAKVHLQSVISHRELPIKDFIKGVRKTDLRPGELITRISFPPLSREVGASFVKFGLRQQQAISVVSVSARLLVRNYLIESVGIALGAVAPTVIRSQNAECFLLGKPPSLPVFLDAGNIARTDACPISDIRGSATFRSHLIGALVQRALLSASGGPALPHAGRN